MARILVADDDADIREIVAVALSAHDCVFATDGVEVTDVLARERVDLVLLDVMMPRRDGFEALREIRHSPAIGDLPVIMLTARVGEDDHLRGFQVGADGYVTKPFDIDALAREVEAVLQRSSEQRQRFREEERAKANLLRQIERRFEA